MAVALPGRSPAAAAAALETDDVAVAHGNIEGHLIDDDLVGRARAERDLRGRTVVSTREAPDAMAMAAHLPVRSEPRREELLPSKGEEVAALRSAGA